MLLLLCSSMIGTIFRSFFAIDSLGFINKSVICYSFIRIHPILESEISVIDSSNNYLYDIQMI